MSLTIAFGKMMQTDGVSGLFFVIEFCEFMHFVDLRIIRSAF